MTLNPFAIIGSILSAIVPDPISVRIQAFIDQLTGLLQGETVLVIGNGAGVAIYLVAKASGKIPDVTFQDAVLQAGAAAVLLNTVLLSIRKYAFSPKTVAAIVASPPTAAGPINAAAAAGVDPAVIGQAIVTAPDAPADVAVAPEVVAATPAPADDTEIDPSTIAGGGDAG